MHALASIKTIVEDTPEPFRVALIQRGQKRGIMYQLKCINPDGLVTIWDGVRRSFKKDEVKLLPAHIAAALWNKYNLAMVGGTKAHGPVNHPPFRSANFEEIVDENRSLGPDIRFVRSGATALSEVLQEVGVPSARRNADRGSEDPGTDEIRAAMGSGTGSIPGKPTPVPNGGTI